MVEIAFSSEMNANLAGKYKAVAGFTVDKTIGTSETPFTGEFDGDFQEISSATMPLFATASGAIIKNVIKIDGRWWIAEREQYFEWSAFPQMA